MDCSGYTAILHCTLCLLLHGTLGHFSASGHWHGPHVSSSLGPSLLTHGHTSPGELVTRARAAAPHSERDFGDLNARSSRGLGRAGWLAGRRGQNGIFARQRWLGRAPRLGQAQDSRPSAGSVVRSPSQCTCHEPAVVTVTMQHRTLQ